MPRDVAHKQDGDQCVVLRALKTQILIQRIKFGVDEGIAIEKVEAALQVNQCISDAGNGVSDALQVHDPELRLFEFASAVRM